MIFFMEGKWDGRNIAYFPAFQYPWLDRQMLDLVLGGAKDLRRKLSHDDQHKLDEYLGSLLTTILACAGNPPDRPIDTSTKQIKKMTRNL